MLVQVDNHVKLPTFSFAKTELRFRGLLQVINAAAGKPTVASLMQSLNSDDDLMRRAIQQSLDDLEASPGSLSVRRRCAYRLAANYLRLSKGWPCGARQVAAGEYGHATITGIELVQDRGGTTSKLSVAYRMLSGRTAGEQIVDRYSSGLVGVIYNMLTDRPRRCFPFSVLLLVGLEAAISLRREMGSIVVDAVGVSRSQQERNRRLTRKRFRQNAPCPYGFGLDCVACAVGRSECGRSVRNIDTDLLS